jgi:hypothetical protein
MFTKYRILNYRIPHSRPWRTQKKQRRRIFNTDFLSTFDAGLLMTDLMDCSSLNNASLQIPKYLNFKTAWENWWKMFHWRWERYVVSAQRHTSTFCETCKTIFKKAGCRSLDQLQKVTNLAAEATRYDTSGLLLIGSREKPNTVDGSRGNWPHPWCCNTDEKWLHHAWQSN